MVKEGRIPLLKATLSPFLYPGRVRRLESVLVIGLGEFIGPCGPPFGIR